MITVKVSTKSDHWYTDINCDLKGAKEYFLGNYFNIAEKMEKVINVEEVK